MMFGHDHHNKDEDKQIDDAAASLAASVDVPSSSINSMSTPVGKPTIDTAPPTPATPPTPPSDLPVVTTPPQDDDAANNDAPDTATQTDETSSNDNDAGSEAPDDLLNLKQQALQQLSPLVNELDQTPEEKFHTMMMMIQASDDQSLIQKAYDAAEEITDSKVKAQALLDIINEINYFTQHPTS